MRFLKPQTNLRNPEEIEQLRRHFERDADRYAEADAIFAVAEADVDTANASASLIEAANKETIGYFV